MRELAAWLSRPVPETFPYDAVLAEFHRVGKHFVGEDLLATLHGVRATLPEPSGPAGRMLARFLDVALDKRDGQFDNPSYLAVELLPLPGTDELSARHAAWQRDRLIALLVADTLRFEIAAAEDSTSMLREMRPDARVTAKRCRLGLRALRPALGPLALGPDVSERDPVIAARDACRAVAGELSPAEARMLQLTMLPVYVVHDEYLFVRMLQCYETTFALMALQLAAGIAALAQGRPAVAIGAIAAAERALREAAPLWSLVTTVQPQAFLAFREFTEGASAIQSRSYKLVESLCRRPDASRLDSAAYRSVPDVRERVLAGHPSLDDTLARARASRRLTADMGDRVAAAMERFEAVMVKWRQAIPLFTAGTAPAAA